MRPLTLDDLLPLTEYASRRRELFAAHARYLDRYRRIRIGPRLTLIFENRQTLWFRVHELLRVARLSDPVLIQEELDLYNRLLPRRGQLQAALLLDVADEARWSEELAAWQTLPGEAVGLHIGAERLPATLVTCRPEDRVLGVAHWVQFPVAEAGRQLLGDFRVPAYFEVNHASYQHASPLLGEEVRQSLIDDLDLSDRD